MSKFFENFLDFEKELLFRMMRLRAIEETISTRYSEQKMRCPVHLCTGQEAVSIAAGLVLRKTDFAVSGHRAHGHYIGKGGDLRRMLAEIYGKQTGCSSGKGGSMHLIDESVGFMGSTAIVGGTIPVGVGLALSIQLKSLDQVSCVFLGDAAIEEGVFFESANFAVLRSLPVIFICENNFYSVYSHLRVRQPEGRKIFEFARAIGLTSAHGDGNNALESYQLISKAIDQIRQGGGPQFLELETYRWREHCGPGFDNDIGYRTESECLEWKAKDPILRLELELLRRQSVDSDWISTAEAGIQEEIQDAFQYAESSSFPPPEEAYTDLYQTEILS